LQDRVWIGDFNWFSNVESKWLESKGVFQLESNAAKVGIPLTEKNIYFYM